MEFDVVDLTEKEYEMKYAVRLYTAESMFELLDHYKAEADAALRVAWLTGPISGRWVAAEDIQRRGELVWVNLDNVTHLKIVGV